MSGRKKKNRKKKRRTTTGGPNAPQHAHAGMNGPGGAGGGGPNVLPGIPGVLPDFPIPPGLELPPGFPNPDSFLSFLFFEHLRKLQERGGSPSSGDEDDDIDDEIDYDDDEDYSDDDEIGMGHHHVGCECHLGHLDHKSLPDVIRDMLRECCEFQSGLGMLINILEYTINRFSLFSVQDLVGIMSAYKVTDFQLELDDSEFFAKFFEASDIKVTFEVLANCVLDYLHDSQWLDFKHITARYGFPAAPPHPYVMRTTCYPKRKKGSKPKPGDPNYDPEQGDREDEFHTGGAAATMNMMTELSKNFYQEIGLATKYVLTHVLKYSRNECLNGFILAIVEDIAFPEDTELNQAVLDVCFTERIDETQAGDYFSYASQIGLTVDADDIKVQQTALNRMCCEHRNQQAGNVADLVRDVMELEIARCQRYSRQIELREKLNKVKAKALPYTSCLCLPTRLSTFTRCDDVAKMKAKGSDLISSVLHTLCKKRNEFKNNEADEVKLQKIEEILQTDGTYVNYYWLYKLYRFATSSKEAFHFSFPTFRALAPSVICSRAMVDYGIIEYLIQSTSELSQSVAKFDLLHVALQTINKAVWALRCAPLALRLRKLVRAKIVQTLFNLREYNKSTPDCNLSIRRLAFNTIELISADRNNELAMDLMNTGLVLTYKSLLPKIFDMSMDQDESVCILNTLKWLLNTNNSDSNSQIAYFMTAFGEDGCVNFIQLKNLSDSKQLSSELASPIHHIHKSISKTPQYQAALKKVPEISTPSSKKQRLCATCQKPAKNKCSVCLKVVYCNRNCQKADWKNHKPNCKKDDNPIEEEEDLPITAAMGSLGTVD